MDIFRKTFVRLLKYDPNNMLNVTRILLRFLGIWTDDGSILVMRIACTLSLSATTIVGTISFMYPTADDITTRGTTIILFVFGIFSMFKILWFFYNSKKIGWLINELERISMENHCKEKLLQVGFIRAVVTTKVLTILLLFMIFIVCLTGTLHCLFLSGNDSKTMFNLYSFIDPTRHYFLALAFQQVYLIWDAPIFLITFNLLMCFTMLSVANMSVLESYLKSAPSNLSHLVCLHTDIISFIKAMNEALRPIIICEMTMGSILTCLCAYTCTQSITLEEKLISYTRLCCELFVPWFICHCGSILEEKSKMLTDAVYSSRWIELKPNQRKEIIILMIATNRPLQIKLSCSHIINYAYYTSFLQMTYSFFTLLLSLNSN